ncbi:MAG: hypothetical protein R3A13_11945 [Bdellovibrionota bacterium]
MTQIDRVDLNRRALLRATAAGLTGLKLTALGSAASFLSSCGDSPNSSTSLGQNLNRTEELARRLKKLGLLVRTQKQLGDKKVIIFTESHDPETQLTVTQSLVRANSLINFDFAAIEGLCENYNEIREHYKRSQEIIVSAKASIITSEQGKLFGVKVHPEIASSRSAFSKGRLITDNGIPVLGVETDNLLYDAACYAQHLNAVYESLNNSLLRDKYALISFHDPNLGTRYADIHTAIFQDMQTALRLLRPDVPVLDFNQLSVHQVSNKGQTINRQVIAIDKDSGEYFERVKNAFLKWTSQNFLENRSEETARRIIAHMQETETDACALICGIAHTINHSGCSSVQEYLEKFGNNQFSYIVVDHYEFSYSLNPFEISRKA